jgi:hypothetical protein
LYQFGKVILILEPERESVERIDPEVFRLAWTISDQIDAVRTVCKKTTESVLKSF